jgi:hypothetical protein
VKGLGQREDETVLAILERLREMSGESTPRCSVVFDVRGLNASPRDVQAQRIPEADTPARAPVACQPGTRAR